MTAEPGLPDFYPRPPRGGRPPEPILPSKGATISIHALRGEGDQHHIGVTVPRMDFYPRPPRGGRRPEPDPDHGCQAISIHALRGEGDPLRAPARFTGISISIHALRGEGDAWASHVMPTAPKFLSTPSAGRATESCEVSFEGTDISIHALRGEGDRSIRSTASSSTYFYPRPPRGGRPTIPCLTRCR